ncbi:hypothetical protein AVEN_61992-1 [Araneus ventricosus]|uniref:Uncharacterized protein n=1 Tax=Araneus ventricosus TaxID=182803 RepID=A0A4Y2L288_ARAVE|nr:hypothetical protein AVEN_61992-1 [Araneus ventricosus]
MNVRTRPVTSSDSWFAQIQGGVPGTRLLPRFATPDTTLGPVEVLGRIPGGNDLAAFRMSSDRGKMARSRSCGHGGTRLICKNRSSDVICRGKGIALHLI